MFIPRFRATCLIRFVLDSKGTKEWVNRAENKAPGCENLRQIEVEMVNNSRKIIHQTWGPLVSASLYISRPWSSVSLMEFQLNRVSLGWTGDPSRLSFSTFRSSFRYSVIRVCYAKFPNLLGLRWLLVSLASLRWLGNFIELMWAPPATTVATRKSIHNLNFAKKKIQIWIIAVDITIEWQK